MPAAAMGSRAVNLTWYGQAAFRLEAGADRVLIDPFLSERPDRRYPPPVAAADVADTTLVLCSHEHDDHLDLAFLAALVAAGGRPKVVAPAPVAAVVARAGVAANDIVGARPGEMVRVGGAEVWPVPAVHGVGGASERVAYGFSSLAAPDEGYRFLGYVASVGGVRVFHAGDSLVYPGMAERVAALAPDVVLLPINGRDFYREAEGTVGNMNEDEAARLAVEIGAPLAVPMHYEGFENNRGDVGRFVSRLAESGRVAALVPVRGQRVRIVPD